MGRMLVLAAPREVAYESTPDGPLAPDEVRIRTLFSGISAGTELTQYRGTSPFLHKRWDADRRLFVPGDSSLSYPVRTWGYEEVDEVIEVGAAVTDIAPGARVFGTWGHRTHHVASADYVRPRLMPAGADPLFGIFSHIGAIGLKPRAGQTDVPVYVDRSMENARNVYCGANEDGTHHSNLSVKRDLKVAGVIEVATARDGDPSPTGTGVLRIKRGIEVGHIFKLGTKYSEAMKCEVADPQQKMVPLQMGCYGLGVGRTVAAAVEQNHDDDGIIWPVPLAPFEVALLSLQRDKEVLEAAEKIYAELTEAGVEVFWDDRDERPGVKFKDADLIGFPVRVVVGGKALAKGVVEVSTRREKKAEGVSPAKLLEVVKATLAAGAKTLAL